MKIKQVFRDFLVELKANNPEIEFTETSFEETLGDFDKTFTKHFFPILQKEKTIFENELPLFGVNISSVWNQTYWKFLQKCSILSILEGNIQEKIKNAIPAFSVAIEELTGKKMDEIDNLLSDEKMPDNFSEVLEMVKNSTFLDLLLSFLDTIDLSEFESVASIDESNLNPESIKNNPAVVKLQEKFGTFMQTKIRNGEVDQQKISLELSQIITKGKELFGETINSMVGGRQGNTSSQEILGNTPEARRARMVARMRRKLEENNSKKNSS